MSTFQSYLAHWRSQKSLPLTVLRTLGYFAKAFILFAGVMVLCQRSLIYIPSNVMTITPQSIGATAVQYRSADGIDITSWYAAPQAGKPVIVMFHGNGGNIAGRGFKQQAFVKQGYGFMLAEYRGYGGNAGSPSENGLYNDARAAMRWLQDQGGVLENDIIIYGESVGTGIAVQMALEHSDAKALILEAPLMSVPDVAVEKMVWSRPLKSFIFDRYMNIDKVPYIRMPLLVLHGTQDEVVPVTQGKALFAAAGSENKQLRLFDGGHHNDLARFGLLDEMAVFLEGL